MEEPAKMVTPFDKYFSLQFATDPTNHITLLLHSLITLSSLWLFTLLACRLYFSIVEYKYESFSIARNQALRNYFSFKTSHFNSALDKL